MKPETFMNGPSKLEKEFKNLKISEITKKENKSY